MSTETITQQQLDELNQARPQVSALAEPADGVGTDGNAHDAVADRVHTLCLITDVIEAGMAARKQDRRCTAQRFNKLAFELFDAYAERVRLRDRISRHGGDS